MEKILIIGSGIAGLSAAKAAIRQNPEAAVTMITQEKYPPYYRIRLCELIGNETSFENYFINPVSWYEENKISLVLSEKALRIDTIAKQLSTATRTYDYDSLVITSGSIPAMPPFKGKELAGIHTLWNLDDISSINTALSGCRSAVIIGGGLLGLETAYHIKQSGIETTLIEGLPRLLPKQLDEEGASIFLQKAVELDINVITGQSVTEFKGGNGHVQEVVISDGQSFKADIVIVSVGVRPDTALCAEAGITTERFIPVDGKMHTNVPGIYTAGDVVSYDKQWFGVWSVAESQGKTAGINAAGGDAVYEAQNIAYILNTMGTRIVSSGDVDLSGEKRHEIQRLSDLAAFSYVRMDFADNRLKGGILMGKAAKWQVKFQTLVNSEAAKETISINDFI
ncbi:MAG: NAD(P)/FAD-dependent oxidoreductase [Saccharofermentanales bacterium]